MKGIIVKIHPDDVHLSVGEVACTTLGNQGQQVHPGEYHFVSMLSAIGFIREQHYDPPSDEYVKLMLNMLEPEL